MLFVNIQNYYLLYYKQMESVEFIKQFPLRHFIKGETLLSEGEDSNVLLAVQTGFIKVTSLSDSGEEKLLWIAGRYDIAPTEQLFSLHGSLHFFYTALSNGTAYQIDKAAFLGLAKKSPNLMAEIATSMSVHYDDLLKRIDSIEKTAVKDKLKSTLLYLAQRFSASSTVDLYELGLKLTHNDLASMIGSTRETTSLELSRLKNEGIIAYDRKQFIVYIDKLSEL
jgi:CRP/FNR family cyclic AMP-dependent transcriptional regulator